MSSHFFLSEDSTCLDLCSFLLAHELPFAAQVVRENNVDGHSIRRMLMEDDASIFSLLAVHERLFIFDLFHCYSDFGQEDNCQSNDQLSFLSPDHVGFCSEATNPDLPSTPSDTTKTGAHSCKFEGFLQQCYQIETELQPTKSFVSDPASEANPCRNSKHRKKTENANISTHAPPAVELKNKKLQLSRKRKSKSRRTGYNLQAGDCIFWESGDCLRGSIIINVWDSCCKRNKCDSVCFDYWPKYARTPPNWNTEVQLMTDCGLAAWRNGCEFANEVHTELSESGDPCNNGHLKTEKISLKKCNFVCSEAVLMIPKAMRRFDEIKVAHLNALHRTYVKIEDGVLPEVEMDRELMIRHKEIGGFDLSLRDRISEFFACTDGLISGIPIYDKVEKEDKKNHLYTVTMKLEAGSKHSKGEFVCV